MCGANQAGPNATEARTYHLEPGRSAGILPLLQHKQRDLAFGMWGWLWEVAGEVDGFSSVKHVWGRCCETPKTRECEEHGGFGPPHS